MDSDLTTSPLGLVEALDEAITRADADAARLLCSEDGWSGPGDAVRMLVEQGIRDGVRLVAEPPAIESGDRALVRLFVRKDGQDLDRIGLHLERQGEGWRAAGLSTFPQVSVLYLQGRLPARMDWAGLPASAPARAWGEAFVAALLSADLPPSLDPATAALVPRMRPILRPGGTVRVAGTMDLPQLGRCAVTLGFSRPNREEPRFIVLQPGPNGLSPYYSCRNADVPSLLFGLGRQPPTSPPTPAGASIGPAVNAAAERGRALLSRVFQQAGLPMTPAGTLDGTAISSTELQARSPAIAAGLAQGLVDELRRTPLALDGLPESTRLAIAEAMGPSSADPSAPRLAALTAHAPALLQRLVDGLGSQVLGQSLKVDITQDGERRTVEVRLGDLLAALAPPTKSIPSV